MAEKIIKKGSEHNNDLKFKFIDRRLINTPSIEVEYTAKEIGRMFEIVLDNFKYSTKIDFKDSKAIDKNLELIAKNEEIINYLHKEINKFLISLNTLKLKDKYVITIGICYKTINYLVQIENLSKDIALAIKEYKDNEKYLDKCMIEIESLSRLVEKILTETHELFIDNEYSENKKRINEIKDLNNEISSLTRTNKELLKSEFDYIRILNNLKRINSHVLCISQALEHRKD
jgi:phosphate:Na+ symporter